MKTASSATHTKSKHPTAKSWVCSASRAKSLKPNGSRATHANPYNYNTALRPTWCSGSSSPPTKPRPSCSPTQARMSGSATTGAPITVRIMPGWTTSPRSSGCSIGRRWAFRTCLPLLILFSKRPIKGSWSKLVIRKVLRNWWLLLHWILSSLKVKLKLQFYWHLRLKLVIVKLNYLKS